MNNRDEEFELLSGDGIDEISNTFNEPNYGNYDYNETLSSVPGNNITEQNNVKSSINISNNNAPIINNKNPSLIGKRISNKKNLKSNKYSPGKLKNNIKNNLGKTSKLAGKTMKGAGKAAKIAGKGTQIAGKGIKAGSNALGTAMSAIPVVGGALGAGTKVIGNAVGSGVDAAGKGVEKAGEKLDNAGSKLKEKGNALQDKSRLKRRDNESKNPINIVKNTFKTIGKILKKILVSKILIPLLLILVVFSVLIDVIYEAFEVVDTAFDAVANAQEKMDNFVNGLGFQNSEDAFFDELETLQKEYEEELNVPLLLATIFYDDIQNNMDPSDVDADVVTDTESMVSFSTAFSFVTSYVKEELEESNVTVGKDGLKYSSNKIYRLRMLAKNMTSKTGTKPYGLLEYGKKVAKRVGKAFLKIIDLTNILEIITIPFNFTESVAEMLSGSEVFETTDFGRFVGDNIFTDIYNLFKTIFNSVFDIKSVGAM